jgi:hypothetical protein
MILFVYLLQTVSSLKTRATSVLSALESLALQEGRGPITNSVTIWRRKEIRKEERREGRREAGKKEARKEERREKLELPR